MSKILILGATSDMSRATAEKFAQNNHDLILAARNVSRLTHFQNDLSLRFEIEVILAEFDAENKKSHPEFARKFKEVEVVLVFFGYLGSQHLAEKNWKETHRIIDVNYVGAVSIVGIFAQYFKERSQGIIIGISSIAGDRGKQSNYIYGSAKAGFSIYLQGLRNRMYPYNVHIATIKPGFTKTKMTEGSKFPSLLTAKSHTIAKAIYKAYRKKRNIVYTPTIWKLIMGIICSIPESAFKKLKM
ncbi:SDR family oxidoreductase [Xanthovirga aplysinae]|uniref:SDR family oxidoreductase n=1 Tax=Xanthovirga aplysinae TaxID=2529853 RepID=UPI0012BBE3E8|nr:SDR family oxidoreductase [Xanthovirga aplysinae]MTI33404.1 SDR family oxidoreductase [Xanthovirga aplysinae]